MDNATDITQSPSPDLTNQAIQIRIAAVSHVIYKIGESQILLQIVCQICVVDLF